MGGAQTRVIVAFVVAAGVGACTGAATFECSNNQQCRDEPLQGRCELTGWCSFPDPGCPSGRRYASGAGDQLANTCVVDDIAGTTGVGEALGSDSSPSADGAGPGGSTAPVADDDDSTGGVSSPSLDTTGPVDSRPPPTTADSTSGSDDGPVDDPAVFEDGFDRPDALMLGNGWVEKSPAAFALVDGAVAFESLAGSYRDNVWYREESLLDVEVCIDFLLLGFDADTHPQVHARLQLEDVAAPGSLTGYILFIDGDQLHIRRDVVGQSVRQWGQPLSSPMMADARFQLCMEVTGTNPVRLRGQLSQWTDDQWSPHTAIAADDDDAVRIDAPGATGSSGADAAQLVNFVYDNFTRVELSPPA